MQYLANFSIWLLGHFIKKKKQTSYFLRGAISMTKGSNDTVVYSRFGFLSTTKIAQIESKRQRHWNL